ncbi:oligopeptide/dipeptide ABC transporter ATP-binding protein [Nonomuraea ferruginea]
MPDPGRPPAAPLTGEVPSALAPPPGCRFHTRCPLATTACEATDPALEPAPDGRLIACIHEETA